MLTHMFTSILKFYFQFYTLALESDHANSDAVKKSCNSVYKETDVAQLQCRTNPSTK